MEKRTLIGISLAAAAVVAALVFAAVYAAPAETDYTGDWTSVQEDWVCSDGTTQGAITDVLTITAEKNGLCSGHLVINDGEDLGSFVGTLAGSRISFTVGNSQYSGVFWSDDVLFTSITAVDGENCWAGSVVFVRNGAAVPAHYVADFTDRSYTVTDSVALLQYDTNCADGMGGTVFTVTEQYGAVLRILFQPVDGSEPWYTVAALAYGRAASDTAAGLYCNYFGSMRIALTADTMQLDLANGYASETICCGTTDATAPTLTGEIWQSATAVMLNEQGERTAKSSGLTVEILSQSGTRFYGLATVAGTQHPFYGNFHYWGKSWVGLAVLSDKDYNMLGTLTLRTADGTALTATATVDDSGEIRTAALKAVAPDYTGRWQSVDEEWETTDGAVELESLPDVLMIDQVVGQLCSGTLAINNSGQPQAFAGYYSGTHISFILGGFSYSGRFWSPELLVMSVVGTGADKVPWAGTVIYARTPGEVEITDVPSFDGLSYTCTGAVCLDGELIGEDDEMIGAVFSVQQNESLMLMTVTLKDGKVLKAVGAVTYTPTASATGNARFAFSGEQVQEAVFSSTGLIFGGASSEGGAAEVAYCGTAVPAASEPNLNSDWQAASAVTMSAAGVSGTTDTVSMTLLAEDCQVFTATLKIGDSTYDLAGILLQHNGTWRGYGYAGNHDLEYRVIMTCSNDALTLVLLAADGGATIASLTH